MASDAIGDGDWACRERLSPGCGGFTGEAMFAVIVQEGLLAQAKSTAANVEAV
jgi:hypothetical protein